MFSGGCHPWNLLRRARLCSLYLKCWRGVKLHIRIYWRRAMIFLYCKWCKKLLSTLLELSWFNRSAPACIFLRILYACVCCIVSVLLVKLIKSTFLPDLLFRNGFILILLLASSFQGLAPSFVDFCDFFEILCYRTMDCVGICVLIVKWSSKQRLSSKCLHRVC